MISHLLDYRVKLKVDGDTQYFTRTAISRNVAKLEAIKDARRLLHGQVIEVVSIEVKQYKPLA